MQKSEFIFNFFSKKIVVIIQPLSKECLVFRKESSSLESETIPFSWYNDALEIFNKRTLN
jgi:hypothetical protein